MGVQRIRSKLSCLKINKSLKKAGKIHLLNYDIIYVLSCALNLEPK